MYANHNQAKILVNLETLYSIDYLRHWQTFLSKLKLTKTQNVDELIRLIQVLAGKNPLLLQIITLLNEQITPIININHQKLFPELFEINDLSKEQGMVQVKTIISQLDQLANLLTTLSTSSNPGKAFFLYAKTLQETTIRTNAELLPPPFKDWMIEIFKQASHHIFVQTYSYIDKVWQTEIYNPYIQNFSSTYPFLANAKEELELKKFKKFFAPQGTLETFYETYLKPFIIINKLKLHP